MAELTEVVADVAEEVADQATSVAEVSRALSPREIKFLCGGIGLGLVAGGVVGGLIIRSRLETKYSKISDDEISEMREHFRARLMAKEHKPPLSEEVENLGYSEPNIAKELNDETTAEEAIAEVVAEEAIEDPEKEDLSRAKVQNIFEEVDGSKDADEGWNYEIEIANRTPNMPYVIHQDERSERDYTETSLIYYAGDDVLCNDDNDRVVEDQDQVIGLPNLEKFGHGSDDKNRVYIRNDDLGMEIEVVRNDGSYAEIVHGFVQHSDRARTMRRRKHPYDDE